MTPEPLRGVRLDDWVRWVIGGLIAGLVAYGSVGNRLTSVEVELRMTKEQVASDREASRKSIEELTIAVNELRQALAIERAIQEDHQRTGAPSDRRSLGDRGYPKFAPQ